MPSKLAQIAAEAKKCRRCPLYRNATQTVFGEGSSRSRIFMIGEQPGDQEDLAGRPFVGPAGRMLDRALNELGVDRRSVYITNAVKHFKFEERGKRRLHKRPNRHEIERCRWWRDLELRTIKPSLIVALGRTAAEALMERPVVLSKERGRVQSDVGDYPILVTTHPSAILRVPDSAGRHSAYAAFVRDLRIAFKAGMPKQP
jgi:uracil-DNA glycosylase